MHVDTPCPKHQDWTFCCLVHVGGCEISEKLQVLTALTRIRTVILHPRQILQLQNANCICLFLFFFSETGSNGLRHLFTVFSWWRVNVGGFFSRLWNLKIWGPWGCTSSFTLKKNSGVPSVSTGNRKTPSRSLSQKNLTYTKLLDEAWYCLAVCMSTCRMETKTVDALYLVWFKQCDLYDLENEHQSGATYFFYTSKNKKRKSLRKANKECSLRFNGLWNQPQKKTRFFATFQAFVIYRENGYPFFICSSLSTAQLSRQLRRAPPTARRPSTPTRWPRRARLPRLPPSWKLKKCGALAAPLAVSGHVWCVLWGFKLWREGNLMQDCKTCRTSKIRGKNSIRQNPPTPKKIALL